jgi:hypothetical protein
MAMKLTPELVEKITDGVFSDWQQNPPPCEHATKCKCIQTRAEMRYLIIKTYGMQAEMAAWDDAQRRLAAAPAAKEK